CRHRPAIAGDRPGWAGRSAAVPVRVRPRGRLAAGLTWRDSRSARTRHRVVSRRRCHRRRPAQRTSGGTREGYDAVDVTLAEAGDPLLAVPDGAGFLIRHGRAQLLERDGVEVVLGDVLLDGNDLPEGLLGVAVNDADVVDVLLVVDAVADVRGAQVPGGL